MELVLPDVKYQDSYIEAVKEFQADPDNSHRSQAMRKLVISDLGEHFDQHVERVRSYSRGENLPEGWVPMTEYWLVEDGEYLGRVSIRHYLNERLEKYHGHIGYDIRPSRRGKGCGTQMLEMALSKAKERGINPVLVTCVVENTASRRVIEKNGGVLLDQVYDPEYDAQLLRFQIDV